MFINIFLNKKHSVWYLQVTLFVRICMQIPNASENFEKSFNLFTIVVGLQESWFVVLVIVFFMFLTAMGAQHQFVRKFILLQIFGAFLKECLVIPCSNLGVLDGWNLKNKIIIKINKKNKKNWAMFKKIRNKFLKIKLIKIKIKKSRKNL